jgi:filamentous hemagglutinin family protein
MSRSVFTPLTLALSLGSFFGFVSTATAQSITATPDGTNTLIDQQSGQYDITGGTAAGQNLFHSFQDFGLNTGETANFIAPGEISNILGRVTGGNPSLINGLIQISGGSPNLFLMNPAGMVFGAGASLNLPASFTATTANAIVFENGFSSGFFNAIGSNNYATLVGSPNQFYFGALGAGENTGAIVNLGNLAVSSGESLSLLGRSLVNEGHLSANQGNLNLGVAPAGGSLILRQPGMVLGLEIVTGEELSTIDLPLLLTSGSSHQAATLVENPDGTVRILTTEPGTLLNRGILQAESGQVLLQAPQVTISGDVQVGGQPLATGGRILVLGDRLELQGANLNASGDTGGGSILVGGDFQGQGDLPTATKTIVDGDSVLTANAIVSGDGGKIVVWADDVTRFEGWASAKGGAVSGDGGLIEISGKISCSWGTG